MIRKNKDTITTVDAKKRAVIIALSLLLLLSGCVKESSLYITEKNGMYSTSFMAMDTVMTVSVISKNAEKELHEAYKHILAYDVAFSAHSQNSEVSKVNNSSGKDISVSDELKEQISTALKVSKMTDGAFDITVFPLMELWGFYDKNHTVPDEASIKDILKLVGYDKIGLEGNMLNLQSGTKIDLGAVTKGFVGQKTAAMLIDSGVKSGMLSLGGNIQLFGLNPDKSVWNIAVQDPKDEHSYIGIIHDTNCSIITSGCYQRYFEKDNKIYHHILNPHTGYPADSGILSVTVVANDGTYADALSTALFVTGLDKAVEIWREYGDFEAIFVTEDKHVYITEGLKDKFTPYSCQDKTDTYLYIYINK